MLSCGVERALDLGAQALGLRVKEVQEQSCRLSSRVAALGPTHIVYYAPLAVTVASVTFGL